MEKKNYFVPAKIIFWCVLVSCLSPLSWGNSCPSTLYDNKYKSCFDDCMCQSNPTVTANMNNGKTLLENLQSNNPSDLSKVCTPKCNQEADQYVRSLAQGNVDAKAYVNCQDGVTNPSDNPTPTASVVSCVSQYSGDISQCSSAYNSAQSDCDTDSGSLSGSASQVALALGQQTSQSVNAACSNMGGISQGASAALATYRMNCKSSKDSCSDTCSAVKNKIDQCLSSQGDDAKNASRNTDDYKKVAAAISTCAALQSKIDQATQAIQNYANTSVNAANCANATAATAVYPSQIPSSDPNSAYCQAHPTDTNCIASCSRTDLPQIASSRTCICFRNPNDAACTGASRASSVGNSLTSQGGGVPSTATSAKASDLNLEGIDRNLAMENLRNRVPNSMGQDDNVGGKQGGGASLDGGSLMPAGKASANHSGLPEAPGNVHMQSGGSFGSAWGVTSYSGSGGGGSSSSAFQEAKEKSQNLPDLRQFLPGGRLDPKKRSVVGMDLHSDITPSQGSNWEKMQNRYRILQQSLLP